MKHKKHDAKVKKVSDHLKKAHTELKKLHDHLKKQSPKDRRDEKMGEKRRKKHHKMDY